MGWRFVLALLLSLVVALFALQNADTVIIRFLTWTLPISQALIILVSAIFGAFTAMMLSLIKQLKVKTSIRADKKTITALENEVSSLKNKLESMDRNAQNVLNNQVPMNAESTENADVNR